MIQGINSIAATIQCPIDGNYPMDVLVLSFVIRRDSDRMFEYHPNSVNTLSFVVNPMDV
ncbi:hypothetical protein HanIR_Chr11g0552511 [Helianthus annuus]|nr:hypothetical protein HanIR_Chr11g0552511 [Helianthus annuus]